MGLLFQIDPWWVETEKKSDGDLGLQKMFGVLIWMLVTHLCSVWENSQRWQIIIYLKMRFYAESSQYSV